MLIQCTKKLLDELKIKANEVPQEEEFFSWHANLIVVNDKKTVVLMNNKNNYVVVLHGLTDGDFENLDEHIFKAMGETFKKDQIDDSSISTYLNQKINYTKTSSRSILSKLSNVCSQVQNADLQEDKLYQSILGIELSKESKMHDDMELLKAEVAITADDTVTLDKPEIKLSKKRMRSLKSGKRNKIGRNDPCPCGSGKKYKKCCLGKAV